MERFGADTGYLHWVATVPAHAGKKLGSFVSLAVLYKFQQEGCQNAVLETDDHRLAAIKTYLRLDFHPHELLARGQIFYRYVHKQTFPLIAENVQWARRGRDPPARQAGQRAGNLMKPSLPVKLRNAPER